ncbi:MAG: hypothetical protein CMK23_10310 [Porticoccaceae bacterium]|nr:hypothetical protein [Porticoccaceae bacterium]|tara:strand:+ start:410 stop:2875 length:2466 start_codon:yes stop_codon:yes gene_type:complete
MAASTKGLSLGKNEDPKKKGGGNVAKQISLDGVNVPPVVGSTKIEEPKLTNARWFGETAVTPAALTKIPQLELPSMRGIIEDATPEDAGNYATALNTFAQTVTNFGSAYSKKIDADLKKYENQAFSVFTEFGDPTQPVKDLNGYISKIDLRIEALTNKEVKTDDDKNEILDLQKLKNQITNNRNFKNVLLSTTNKNIVLNRAYNWTYAKKDIMVPDTNLEGGITDKNAELKEIRVSELDPSDSRYVEAFNKYVYGGVDLSTFEHNNVSGTISNILAQDRYKQEGIYADLTKNKILISSNNLLDEKIPLLINAENGFSVAAFNTEMQETLEFINNTHLFTKEEKLAFVKTIVSKLEFYLGDNPDANVEDIVNEIFLGKDLGTENAVHPLMMGPLSGRFKKNNQINKKQMLVEQIGGKDQLNIIIGNTIKKQLDTKDKIELGNIAGFETEFGSVLTDKTQNGKSFMELIIDGQLDSAYGNEHVAAYITALKTRKQELTEKFKDNPKMLDYINQAYNKSITNVENNLLASDYEEELSVLIKMSHKIAAGDDSLMDDFNDRVTMFESSYPINKATKDLTPVLERVNKFQTATNKSLLKVGIDQIKTLHNEYAEGRTEDYNKDSVYNTHELQIQRDVEEIVEEANKLFPNDREGRQNYVTDTINARWNNGDFIPDRKTKNRNPVYGFTKTNKAIKNFFKDTKKGGIDADGIFVDEPSGKRNFLVYVNKYSRPVFRKEVLFNKDFSDGLIVKWMSGEDIGEEWDIIEKNLEFHGIDTVDFFLQEVNKLGIPPKKFFKSTLLKFQGLTKEERRILWEKKGVDVEEEDK